MQGRLWITHQTAFEYLNKRLTVIYQQQKPYDDMVKSIKEIEEKLLDESLHPFISEKMAKKLCAVFAEVNKELSSNKNTYENAHKDDPIQAKLDKLLTNKISSEYTKEELEKIYKEGEDRYKNIIPPGYKDISKDSSNPNSKRKFGDFIIWKQILDKAKNDQVDIIFITDDLKEDWWEKLHDKKTVGARPELIREFTNVTKRKFHLYDLRSFLKFYNPKFLDVKIKDKLIEEIKDKEMHIDHYAPSSYLESIINRTRLKKALAFAKNQPQDSSPKVFLEDQLYKLSNEIRNLLKEQEDILNSNLEKDSSIKIKALTQINTQLIKIRGEKAGVELALEGFY